METALLTEPYSDPYFKVYQVPPWRARFYKFLSVDLWGALPSPLQKKISSFYASHYDRPYSRWIIKPYLLFHYRDRNYLAKFKPPRGKADFESFQDFFIREFRQLPDNDHPSVWPCEGLVCDKAPVREVETVRVKCDTRCVATIFGVEKDEIPADYTFSNVFLHNKNYHRIHAPVSGTITRIQHVPGDLVVLRPWIYKQNPSLPAFRNERYNLDITDDSGKVWYLSVVGGPAVGTIQIPDGVEVGSSVDKLQELAVFYLGSTCCMAAPRPPAYHGKNAFVEVGTTY